MQKQDHDVYEHHQIYNLRRLKDFRLEGIINQ